MVHGPAIRPRPSARTAPPPWPNPCQRRPSIEMPLLWRRRRLLAVRPNRARRRPPALPPARRPQAGPTERRSQTEAGAMLLGQPSRSDSKKTKPAERRTRPGPRGWRSHGAATKRGRGIGTDSPGDPAIVGAGRAWRHRLLSFNRGQLPLELFKIALEQFDRRIIAGHRQWKQGTTRAARLVGQGSSGFSRKPSGHPRDLKGAHAAPGRFRDRSHR